MKTANLRKIYKHYLTEKLYDGGYYYDEFMNYIYQTPIDELVVMIYEKLDWDDDYFLIKNISEIIKLRQEGGEHL